MPGAYSQFLTLAETAAETGALFNIKNCLLVATLLFIIGAFGVISRRNILIMLISIELMLNAVNLVFASFARAHVHMAAQTGNPNAGESGQIFALFVIAIAAAEAAVGLAIVITYFRNRETVDTRDMRMLSK